MYDIHLLKEEQWIATKTQVHNLDTNETITYNNAITQYSALHVDSNGIQLHNSNQDWSLGKIEQPSWTQTERGWFPEAIQGKWIDIARREKRLWLLDQEGIWVQNSTNKPQKLYEHKHLSKIQPSSLYVWGLSTSGDLFHFTLGKQHIYDSLSELTDISAGAKSVCVAGKRGLFRVWQRKKDAVEVLLKGSHFTHVWSTENGDCWFITDNEQVGVYTTEGSNRVWNTPPRIGKTHTITFQKGIGLWIHTRKGLWLKRIWE